MRVVLWVYVDTMFREMIRVARVLKSRTTYRPLIWFNYRYPEIERDFAICRAEGIDFEHDAPTAVSPRPDPKANLLKRCLIKGYDTALAWARRLRYAARRRLARRPQHECSPLLSAYRNRHEAIRAEVQRLKPRLLILPEDNPEYATASWIDACHEVGAPSLVIPYTLANAGEFAEAYWNNPDYHLMRPDNAVAGQLYPHWVYRYKGRDLIRLPAERVLALEQLELAPPNPWAYNSGAADAIAVESAAVLEYYVRSGLPRQQLRLTGSLRQDDLARSLPEAAQARARLLGELGLPPHRPTLLWALPPDQRPQHRPGCEFHRYEDLVAFWAQTLGALPDCNVVVNLHPRLTYDELKHIERWGVRIVRDDIARLIPLCDLYLASVSATICLAIACGKPVLNYDVYRYGYDDFAAVPSVCTVDTRAAFVRALHDHLERLPALTAAAQQEAQAWGNLDGKAQERLLALLDELIQGKRKRFGKRPAA